MAVIHLFLGSLNINLHDTLRQVPMRSRQHVFEEASCYRILIKRNFCNFTLCCPICCFPQPQNGYG